MPWGLNISCHSTWHLPSQLLKSMRQSFSAVLCLKCNLMVWFPGLYGLLVEKFPDKMTHSSGHEWPHSVWLKLGKRSDSPWLVSPSSWAQQSTICVFPPSRGYLGHNQGAITFCWLFSNSASYHRSVCSSALNPRDQTFTWVMNFGWVRGYLLFWLDWFINAESQIGLFPEH